jgi:DNA-binding HxlR family transcriptional regulator
MLGTILEESLNMSIESIEQDKLENTGFSYTLSLINGKYKITILYYLTAFDVVRFNEMKRYIGAISFKTLSLSLKELESDGLIIRNEYPQIPPKVEYSLSAHGKTLIPILEAMCEWGELHKTTAKKK